MLSNGFQLVCRYNAEEKLVVKTGSVDTSVNGSTFTTADGKTVVGRGTS